MGKPALERQLADNEVKAVGRMIRTSQYKLNLVAGLIRGKKVDQAINDLTFSRRRIANDVLKVLRSAVANAENNHNLDVDELVVAQAWTGKNLVLKRFHARGRGRGAGILKPFSEVTIVLREQKPEEKEDKKAKAKAKKSGKGGNGKQRQRQPKKEQA
ncbi:MAG: 50S ribosomal protein L22 [Alphaproteobacteria bacterium]|nr:50S ribosomal protein L22 [Alphaproteobacteria bacterium]